MSFLEIMHTYFRGEKLEALYFILPAGILLITLGITAIMTEKGGFAWGIAIPCILFGLVLVGTGIGVGARTAGQVAELEQQFEADPVQMVIKELPRMEKVNANFRLTYLAFGIIAVVGLLIHYFGGSSWGRGLGAALILICAIGLLVDGFAERRAAPYTKALEQIGVESQSEQ